jgi:hypothetical protein
MRLALVGAGLVGAVVRAGSDAGSGNMNGDYLVTLTDEVSCNMSE